MQDGKADERSGLVRLSGPRTSILVGANDLTEGAGNARTVARPGSNAGSESGCFDANRNANVALAQRSKVETAKTTTKRAAFVANIVQKTPTYPIDENHAQSTTMPLMRTSAKSKTMTAISTPMRLEGMLLRRAVRVKD